MGLPRAVVLVEGESDRAALMTLAERQGRRLGDEGVAVLAMGGITNVRRYARDYGPLGCDVLTAGLYDAPEESQLRRGLAGAGIPQAQQPGGLVELGFFGCVDDLEQELIRALGVDAVHAVVEAAGDARPLRSLSQMPAQQGWTDEALLRRFLAAGSGRKVRYARRLVRAMDPALAPRPLRDVLDRL